MAFSLIELTAAVAIVGVISALAISNYSRTLERQRWNIARAVLLQIYAGEQVYLAMNSNLSYYPAVAPSRGNCTITIGNANPYCIGMCQAAAGATDINCRTAWRSNLNTDDPNMRRANLQSPEVVYQVEAAGVGTLIGNIIQEPAGGRVFLATATYDPDGDGNGEALTVDKNRVFGGTWTPPP